MNLALSYCDYEQEKARANTDIYVRSVFERLSNASDRNTDDRESSNITYRTVRLL
jgi:hypothetical protein